MLTACIRLAIALSVLLPICAHSQPAGNEETPESWYTNGQATVARNLELATAQSAQSNRRARNVILFVGDGMGISTVTAARILEGQLKNHTGEENRLFFEEFPNVALAKTYNTNMQVADSAGTMSAMVTGVKTDAGVISVNQNVFRGDCASQTGTELPTILELAEARGLATGIVSTARITHATPAANYAHIMDRDFEDDGDATSMRNAGACVDIARQLLEFKATHQGSDGIEVVLGGGRRSFIPRIMGADPETGGQGERLDGRDLTQEWLHGHPHSAFVWNQEQFDALDTNAVDHLLGLFDMSHMEYNLDRHSDAGGEPSLSEMTAKAIQILERNEQGYYLNVEAGRIDHAHHATNPKRALLETIELARAVKIAYEMTDPQETLILVTADHSHVFTIAGYPARGNPILGKVTGVDANDQRAAHPALAADGLPYTTLGYINGPGYQWLPDRNSADAIAELAPNLTGRTNLQAVDTTHEGFHPETLVPLKDETHAGEDVPVYAIGPGSELVRGVMEQNVLFHIMVEALGFSAR